MPKLVSIKVAKIIPSFVAGILMPNIATPQSLDNLFEVALGTAGLTTQSARFDSGTLQFYYQPKFSTLIFQQVHQDPWSAPWMLKNFREELASTIDRPSATLAIQSRMMGMGINRALLGNPLSRAEEAAKRPGALQLVLQDMKSMGLVKGNIPPLNRVPGPVQEAATMVLQVALDTYGLRQAALANLNNLDSTFNRIRRSGVTAYAPMDIVLGQRETSQVEFGFMSAAGQDLAAACTVARDRLLGVIESESYDWSIETAWGMIALSGGSNKRYEGQYLLVIDSSGNDTYIGLPSNRSSSQWLSVVLDSEGNDSYLSHAELQNTTVAQSGIRKTATGLGPAAATLGFAYLFDLRGNDLYRTVRPGNASAQYGMAILSDLDGNDVYDSYTQACGFAEHGIALLEDQSGNDRYFGFNATQGHGTVGGFGCLIDRSGDDRYVANNEVIDFPSPQSATSNVSMSQGAATGRRADYLDGQSQNGGIGLLYDLGGDDQYSAGVFAQGVGYWGGLGMLWDRAGTDQYLGDWYVQGASAHFAFGYLEDESGADRYEAKLNMAQGAGHDFSVGMLLDRNGNDEFFGPNLSLGAGNANGIGVFLDFEGDDKYTSLGLSLGRSAEAPKSSLRERCLSLGLFYDGGGTDVYPASATWAKPTVRLVNWTDRGLAANQSQLGIFWDR